MSSHTDLCALLAGNDYFIKELSVILDKHRSKYYYVHDNDKTRNYAYDIPQSYWGLLNFSHTQNDHT